MSNAIKRSNEIKQKRSLHLAVEVKQCGQVIKEGRNMKKCLALQIIKEM